jgi:EF-P beta-lysylation protein EpmB
MLTRSEACCKVPPWKLELRRAITRPEELLEFLDLDPGLLAAARAAARRFPLLVPRGYAALMERSNPQDPLLLQVLPIGEELRDPPGFCTDPLGERAEVQEGGLLHKYQGRALLLVSGACAIHCRYCFRRHVPFGESSARRDRSDGPIAQLVRDPSVSEVILSGGDPLMLDDPNLGNLVQRLGEIPHLRRLRLHTRIPIVLPSRVTDRLCNTLAASPLQPVLVVHTNHARELGTACQRGLRRLRDAGATLLNQSVLLRGVNDDAHRLAQLSEALFECQVLPYYLHLLDRVSGAAHFDLDQTKAVRILDGLRKLLPGYLVPRLVREVAGEPYKIPIDRGIPVRDMDATSARG